MHSEIICILHIVLLCFIFGFVVVNIRFPYFLYIGIKHNFLTCSFKIWFYYRLKSINRELITWLLKPGGSIPQSKRLPIIPTLSQINPIPHIDNYFFNIHSNIVLPYMPKLSKITPTFFHSRFYHPDYIRWTVQTMKFLIVKPSPLPILSQFGPKYSP